MNTLLHDVEHCTLPQMVELQQKLEDLEPQIVGAAELVARRGGVVEGVSVVEGVWWRG